MLNQINTFILFHLKLGVFVRHPQSSFLSIVSNWYKWECACVWSKANYSQLLSFKRFNNYCIQSCVCEYFNIFRLIRLFLIMAIAFYAQKRFTCTYQMTHSNTLAHHDSNKLKIIISTMLWMWSICSLPYVAQWIVYIQKNEMRQTFTVHNMVSMFTFPLCIIYVERKKRFKWHNRMAQNVGRKWKISDLHSKGKEVTRNISNKFNMWYHMHFLTCSNLYAWAFIRCQ